MIRKSGRRFSEKIMLHQNQNEPSQLLPVRLCFAQKSVRAQRAETIERNGHSQGTAWIA
jgi:hypothetical protein